MNLPGYFRHGSVVPFAPEPSCHLSHLTTQPSLLASTNVTK